ncbi:trans-sulfuration enzyme family protein [Specibacter sp. AOP5-B1-6]|uniref:trans-sulfuration enzyme family protein n=1 Tax=Specibacter sp. AOP5-B1-6 TaxID=3457653 RepID=UPI00402B1397
MTNPAAAHPDQLSPDTVVVAAGRPAREHDAPVNPPLVLSSTYVGTGQVVDGDRAYGRYSNPTWDPLEDALAQLEGATLPALIFSSGLAAASAALSLVPVGGVLVMPIHSYQGALVMAQELAAKGLFTLRTVDIANNDEVIAALTGAGEKAADMLWLESPTNPMLEVADIHVLCRAAQAVGAVVVTDNTFSTPLVQKPLELGADVVLHSVTKYLAGHSDVILGALATSNPELRATLLHHRSIHGAIAGPFEAWLALRGLRTLALRVERSQASALVLANRLDTHDGVTKVLFPGLPSDPGHARAKAQMSGFGSILCIEVAGGAEAANAVVEALCVWTPATSLGGVESLIERRRRHANEPDTVPENLLRLSVGIENVEDLWNDLEQAFALAAPGASTVAPDTEASETPAVSPE